MATITTNNLGYPRIGEKRELKKATEAYWKGELSRDELLQTAKQLRLTHWKTQQSAGIDLIPSNDFSFYDQMLDMSCLLGVIPDRFNFSGETVDLDTMFTIARGKAGAHSTVETYASEMTKWFDANYHYIVPELKTDAQFRIASTKVFDEFTEAKDAGILTKPVLIGPVTYLILSKSADGTEFDRLSLLDSLVPVYDRILKKLADLGAEWIQIDEPVFALDMTDSQRTAAAKAYQALSGQAGKARILVASYFGELRDNRKTFLNLPVDAVHVDAVRAADELDYVLNELPDDKILSVGVVDGRNIWKNDYEHSLALLSAAQKKLGDARIMVAPSCSLIHSPVTLRNEDKLDDELKSWMAFAEEKLSEVATLAKALTGTASTDELQANRQAMDARRSSSRIHNDAVKQRVKDIKDSDANRASEFSKRRKAQQDKLGLPLFPTTTIGSFPQTKEVRSMRAKFRKGELSQAEYDAFIAEQIKDAVAFQEQIGIDMHVHGEFERNDMVEYFGEQLEGYAFTRFGWVQSYGSRYVKPPIIFGDVSRPEPMTVKWSTYAQELTDKPMKGMLSGPITMLQWSFVRNDQPRSETAMQIALALRDEVADLEKAGLAAIQIDEPALREGLPLRKSDWQEYLDWAVKAFGVSAAVVGDATQIHTHMCYCEFNDIIDSIAALDADVISIETSRSNMELLDAFVDFKYPNEIGPGVYDIHSPRVPDKQEMVDLLKKAEKVLPREHIWVNPDCGLKTRGWNEVKPALEYMVAAARELRS